MRERITLETRTRTALSTGGSSWVTTATETRWAEAVVVTAEARQRYDSIDQVIEYEFRFRGYPAIDLDTRFIWATDGHVKNGHVYAPAAPPENVDGTGRMTSVLVYDTGGGRTVLASVAISASTTATVEAT